MKKYLILVLLTFSNLLLLKGQIIDTSYIKKDSLNFEKISILTTSNGDASMFTPQMIPPSPQSQIFEKYFNNPVTEYNGLPQIEIPLYEVNIKGMTIPIALSYHAGGIRVDEYEGEVGLGWSISAGGYRVTRTINNKPDEASVFYDDDKIYSLEPKGPEAVDRYLGDIHNTRIYPINDAFNGALLGVHGKNIDGEYDLFTYMTPSTNGHFIISNRHFFETTIFEDKLDLIKLNNTIDGINSTIDDLVITDDKGFNYYLGGAKLPTPLVERLEPDADAIYERTITAWPLRQIKSPYNELVNFSYVTLRPRRSNSTPTLTILEPNVGGGNRHAHQSIHNYTSVMLIIE